MGAKASNNFQSDRPESGGANKDDMKDKTGLHELDKQKLGSHRADLKAESHIPQRGENPALTELRERREQSQRDAAEEQGTPDETP
jgi:hypothetical protein